MIGALIVLAVSSWSIEIWVEIPPSPEAQAAAVAATASENEAVVNGTRVRRLELRVRTDRKTGQAACTLKRESGDRALDTAFCEQALACNRPRPLRKALEACMMPRVDQVVRTRYPGRAISPPTRTDRF